MSVTLRLVYLIFCQLSAWMALLAWSEASKTAEILVLRHQAIILSPFDHRMPARDVHIVDTHVRITFTTDRQ